MNVTNMHRVHPGNRRGRNSTKERQGEREEERNGGMEKITQNDSERMKEVKEKVLKRGEKQEIEK